MMKDELSKIVLPNKVYSDICTKVVDLFKKLNINSLKRIDPFYIASKCGYILHPYSSGSVAQRKGIDNYNCDGYSYLYKGMFHIVYDDRQHLFRQRFTIMHEIGHIILGHYHESDLANMMANYFASYALAPYPIIDIYDISDYMMLAERFTISNDCANYCFASYCNWKQYHCNKKNYELVLLNLFH